MASEFRGRAYCGAPPLPDVLWTRWNLDPILIVVILALLAAYVWGFRASRGAGGSQQRATFIVGWATAALALISPLCALSVSLFSARVGQHMVLSLVAAPLIVMGRPTEVYGALLPASTRGALSRLAAVKALGAAIVPIAFTVSMWFWHAPGPYAATFASPVIYWLMHLTVFGAALMVWSVILDRRPSATLAAMVVGGVATLQMTALGALITMTRHPLYSPHFATTLAWGMTPETDQQLGGLIMWVPGCLIFLAATILTLGRALGMRPPAKLVA